MASVLRLFFSTSSENTACSSFWLPSVVLSELLRTIQPLFCGAALTSSAAVFRLSDCSNRALLNASASSANLRPASCFLSSVSISGLASSKVLPLPPRTVVRRMM